MNNKRFGSILPLESFVFKVWVYRIGKSRGDHDCERNIGLAFIPNAMQTIIWLVFTVEVKFAREAITFLCTPFSLAINGFAFIALSPLSIKLGQVSRDLKLGNRVDRETGKAELSFIPRNTIHATQCNVKHFLTLKSSSWQCHIAICYRLLIYLFIYNFWY